MAIKNDIKQAKINIDEKLSEIENELESLVDKIRFKIGVHLPFGWWFFGAGFTLAFLLNKLADAIS